MEWNITLPDTDHGNTGRRFGRVGLIYLDGLGPTWTPGYLFIDVITSAQWMISDRFEVYKYILIDIQTFRSLIFLHGDPRERSAEMRSCPTT